MKWIKTILRRARKSQKTFPTYDHETIMKPISREKLARKVANKLGINSLTVLKESFMKCDLEGTWFGVFGLSQIFDANVISKTFIFTPLKKKLNIRTISAIIMTPRL